MTAVPNGLSSATTPWRHGLRRRTNQQYDDNESALTKEDWGGDTLTKIAWSVKENPDTPRRFTENELKAFRSTQSSVASNATQAVCENPNANVEGYADISPTARNRGMGIEISASSNNGLLDTAPDEYYFYACVRGNPAGGVDDHGAWAISSGRKFIGGQPSDNLGADAAAGTTARTVDFSWTAVTNTTAQYHIEYVLGSTISDSTPSPRRVNETRSTSITRTVSSLTSGSAYAWRIRYSVSVGGRRLYSGWTSSAQVTPRLTPAETEDPAFPHLSAPLAARSGPLIR